jgi:hypothetical protein
MGGVEDAQLCTQTRCCCCCHPSGRRSLRLQAPPASPAASPGSCRWLPVPAAAASGCLCCRRSCGAAAFWLAAAAVMGGWAAALGVANAARMQWGVVLVCSGSFNAHNTQHRARKPQHLRTSER